MSLASKLVVLLATLTVQSPGAWAAELRICADPNNLPYSNERQEGLENRIAQLIASDLDMKLQYLWFPQRKGFLRKTLTSGRCDVVMGVPLHLPGVATTSPYYRSSYVFVSRRSDHLKIQSFDDPRLRDLKIGVNVLGEATDSVPPLHSLLLRGLAHNLAGYSIFGNLYQQNPATRLIEAVARGEVDVAVAWGPLAGYAMQHASVPLEMTPILSDPRQPDFPLVFDIAVGTRPQNELLRGAIDRALKRHHVEIESLLRSYGIVPQSYVHEAAHAQESVR